MLRRFTTYRVWQLWFIGLSDSELPDAGPPPEPENDVHSVYPFSETLTLYLFSGLTKISAMKVY